MIPELLYATNNPGKIIEVTKLLDYNRIKVVSPADLNIKLEVPESGNSLEENATLKTVAYLVVSGGRLVLADDTGLEIDALGGEPGIHVRRWRDGQTEMKDEEIIAYCLRRMEGIPFNQRGARFRTVLILGRSNGKTEIYDGTLKGKILEKADDLRIKGFPFESLFYVPEWQMLLGKAHQLGAEEKGDRLNHRERALQKAIPRIRELLK